MSSPPLAIRAGQVFDGREALGPATVVVEDGLITAVEQRHVPGALDLGDDVTARLVAGSDAGVGPS